MVQHHDMTGKVSRICDNEATHRRYSMPPNIVWVNCDQLRWDAVGYSGNPVIRTPNIDKLAERGVWFENAYCASPVCSPARASMVTGLYPHAHHQFINYGHDRTEIWGCSMPEDIVTIGDVLHAGGYACGNAGVWHLGPDDSPQHGLSDFWAASSYMSGSFPDPFFRYLEDQGLSNPYGRNAEGVFRYGKEFPLGVLTHPGQQRTTWTVNRSLEFLAQDHKKPFCLLVGIKDPHPPCIPPQELLALYPPHKLPFPKNFHDQLEGKPAFQAQTRCRVPPGSINVEDYRTVIRYYYALVTHVDHEIGRLVECLEQKGIFDQTIFVVNSDHGEMLGNHGFVEKCLMYEESVRVPCLISWPDGLPADFSVSAPLAGVDMVPTLLDLVEAPIPKTMDGRSIAGDLCARKQPEVKPIFAEIASDAAIYKKQFVPEQFAAHVLVRDGGWKYVWNRYDDNELYQLDTDPSEMANLAGEFSYSDRISHMRQLILDMLRNSGPGIYDWCFQDNKAEDSAFHP